MIYRFSQDKIKCMLFNQLNNNYFSSPYDEKIINEYWLEVLEKLEKNFLCNSNKYYARDNNDGSRDAYFDPLHTCQWMIFLYILANTIFRKDKSLEARELCDKLYGLSKMISGADIYYEVELPAFFFCDHPTGAVMGRATYGDGFSFIQGCTVGNNHGVYPVIGRNVTMCSNSKIIGNCKIGDNVIISANAYIKDQDIPSNVIVFGSSPNLIFKSISE